MNKKEGFYLLELYRQIGSWSGKENSFYKRHDGTTPNVNLAKKYPTYEKALKDQPKIKYPYSRILKYSNGEIEAETK